MKGDNFASYADIQALMRNTSYADYSAYTYQEIVTPSVLSLDNSVTYNGHKTLKVNQPAGSASYPNINIYFPHQPKAIWLKVISRLSQGWTGEASSGADGQKWLFIGPNTASGRVHLGMYGDGRYNVELSGIPNVPFSFCPSNSECPSGSYVSSSPRHPTDESWFEQIVFAEALDSPGRYRIRVWSGPAGGRLSLTFDMERAVASGSTGAFRSIGILKQQNTRAHSEAMWIGEWEVVDGDRYPDPYGLVD